MSLQDAANFLDQHDTCVIATVSTDGKPEAATVGFSHDESFKILIATNQSTRKAKNLLSNPKIALVTGFEGAETVQIEGVAEMKTIEELGDRLEKHFTKVPGARKHVSEAGQAYFLITPSWLRHTNFMADPPIFETKDFA